MLVGVAAVALGFYIARVGRADDAELAGQHAASLCGVRTDRGLPVGVAARAGAIWAADLTLSRAPSSESDAYDDIVLAANLFSQNQTGALIVIEREIGLRTYIESGVPLDARLSYDSAGDDFPAQRSPA